MISKYKEEHRDKIRAYQKVYSKNYRLTHKEKIKSYQEKYKLTDSYKQRAKERFERWKNKLPQHIVYAWISPEDGKAFYVGRGTYIRPYKHKNASWWNSNLILFSMTCEDEWDSMEWEGKWGKRLRPLYNIDGYRRKGENNGQGLRIKN